MVQRVITFGTFDFLRMGHILFLQSAATFGELYVVVLSDARVLEKKSMNPLFNEEERRAFVARLPFVKGTYIGSIAQGLTFLDSLSPNFFYFGTDGDQWAEGELERIASARSSPLSIIRDAKTYESVRSSEVRAATNYDKETLRRLQEGILAGYSLGRSIS